MAKILLDYFFPITAISPTPQASTAFLKQVLAVVKPKVGVTPGTITLTTERPVSAAVAYNQFLAMLRLYTQPGNALSQRQINGIVGLSHCAASAWLHDQHGAAYVRGVQISVTLDESAYVGASLHTFIVLLDHFFGLYVHLNSYTQLVALSHSSGKELLRCLPRNGDLPLV